MRSEFSAEFFSGNRDRLRALFSGTAPIVITGSGLVQRSTDSAYSFQQDGSFWYLTGIDEPNVVLVMDKNKEYLILPAASSVKDVFDGATDAAALAATSGIDAVLTAKDGWRQLMARLKKVKHIATLSPPVNFEPTFGMFTNGARQKLVDDLRSQNSEVELLDLSPHLQKLRMVKSESELAAINKAISITTQSLSQVKKQFQKQQYTHEFEIDNDLYKNFRLAGSRGHAFDPIVASGEHGATLHYNKNDSQIDYELGVVIDVGAEYNHYAADITRTWSVDPSKRLTAVHKAVCEVHEFAVSLLRPGTLLKDYELKIEHFMGEKLRALGLISVIDHESVRKYFPHSTSHFLGIDVHDVGDYNRPLEPGVVLTVEPGIYIPAENIGVRIEDDILITSSGSQNLSASLPHDLS